MIAHGISDVTKLPIMTNVIIRKKFISSQTQKDRWTRLDNVEGVFELVHGENIQGKHILLIDDVVTTGATICSCVSEMQRSAPCRVSILSLGFTKS